MAKRFFKEYVELKTKIEREKCCSERDEDFELTCSCFDSISRYLFSYRWSHSDRERLLFDTCETSLSLSELAESNKISYNTLRSISSRVSARLYAELGNDFQKIVLEGYKNDKIRLMKYCNERSEDYCIQRQYPTDILTAINKTVADVHVPEIESFKIRRKDLVLLKLLADYDMDTIFKKLALIDTERLVVYYEILSNKRYYRERAEVLSYIHEMADRVSLETLEAEKDVILINHRKA